MANTDFVSLTPSVAQGHLRCRYIVVPDVSLPPLTFDRQGFRELDSLDAAVTIEGRISVFMIPMCMFSYVPRSDNDTQAGRLLREACAGHAA